MAAQAGHEERGLAEDRDRIAGGELKNGSIKTCGSGIAFDHGDGEDTKAMQMVRHQKLRPRETAAEAGQAAYAGKKMDAVISTCDRGLRLCRAPALLAGTGKDPSI